MVAEVFLAAAVCLWNSVYVSSLFSDSFLHSPVIFLIETVQTVSENKWKCFKYKFVQDNMHSKWNFSFHLRHPMLATHKKVKIVCFLMFILWGEAWMMSREKANTGCYVWLEKLHLLSELLSWSKTSNPDPCCLLQVICSSSWWWFKVQRWMLMLQRKWKCNKKEWHMYYNGLEGFVVWYFLYFVLCVLIDFYCDVAVWRQWKLHSCFSGQWKLH